MSDITVYITLEDNEGNEDTFTEADTFEMNGNEYSILVPYTGECLCEDCTAKLPHYLFSVEDDGEEITFVGVTDEIEERNAMDAYNALCEEGDDD
jgi:uncharacterized protein YrzB (UPF0473 family)